MRVTPPEVRLTLPTRTDMVPLTQCRAVSTHCAAMTLPEQVNEPLLSTAAAQGADETVPPPMIGCGPAGAADAADGDAEGADQRGAEHGEQGADAHRVDSLAGRARDRRVRYAGGSGGSRERQNRLTSMYSRARRVVIKGVDRGWSM